MKCSHVNMNTAPCAEFLPRYFISTGHLMERVNKSRMSKSINDKKEKLEVNVFWSHSHHYIDGRQISYFR